jgi:hypothetical protein
MTKTNRLSVLPISAKVGIEDKKSSMQKQNLRG